MIKIHFILIIGLFISCKNKVKEEAFKYPPINFTITDMNKQWPLKSDTDIGQQIWYYKGKYVLQTYVQSQKWYIHFSPHRDPFDSSLLHGYGTAPYNADIIGNFDFIKRNKSSEYNKAKLFLNYIKPIGDSIQRIENAKAQIEKNINDSIELLKNVPIK